MANNEVKNFFKNPVDNEPPPYDRLPAGHLSMPPKYWMKYG